MYDPAASTKSYLPANYVGFGEAFESSAQARPFGFEAWAVICDETAAQCEDDEPGSYGAVISEMIDKAHRRGAFDDGMARRLRLFFEVQA